MRLFADFTFGPGDACIEGVRWVIATMMSVIACSGQVDDESRDEQAKLVARGVEPPPAPVYAKQEQPIATTRVTHHGGPVLAKMTVRVGHVGDVSEGGASSAQQAERDALVGFTLTSGAAYWETLAQYGVGPGRLAGAQRIPKALAFAGAMAAEPLVSVEALEAQIKLLLHPKSGASIVPPADAYLFFLPKGTAVSFGNRGTKVWKSCVDVGAYHRHTGLEPYAVFPPCDLGQSPRAVSHELAEMATDPVVGTGWMSDRDQNVGVGEIADLCNQDVPAPIGGYRLTQLWSNHDGRCVPF